MKRCPSCNRTYADETISFCLADGSLLSASYDSSIEEPPPTESLPAPSRSAMPPTQRAKVPIPTITSFPLQYDLARTDHYRSRPLGKSRALIWAVGTLVGVAIIAGIIFALRHSTASQEALVSTSNPPETPIAANSPSSPVVSPMAGPIRSSPTRSPIDNKSPSTLDADPVLFPKPSSSATPRPTPSTEIDYSKIFSGRDVTSKARVLEKPEPSYTAIARQNQVTGTVVLRALFSSSGQVTEIHVVAGLPDGLSERAIAAAKQIRFVPATKDGHPVSMWMELQYNFNLY